MVCWRELLLGYQLGKGSKGFNVGCRATMARARRRRGWEANGHMNSCDTSAARYVTVDSKSVKVCRHSLKDSSTRFPPGILRDQLHSSTACDLISNPPTPPPKQAVYPLYPTSQWQEKWAQRPLCGLQTEPGRQRRIIADPAAQWPMLATGRIFL